MLPINFRFVLLGLEQSVKSFYLNIYLYTFKLKI
jgi:hypothetical protein